MYKLTIIALSIFLLSGCSRFDQDEAPRTMQTRTTPTVTTNSGSLLTEAEARAIAEKILNDGEQLTSGGTYNHFSQTWWFDVNFHRPGCFPGIVVYEATRTTELNWRCTGALPSMNGQ